MELLALTVPASLGGDVSDAGCLVVFRGMVRIVEQYGIPYTTTILKCPLPPNGPQASVIGVPIVQKSATSWPTNMIICFHVQWANMSYLIKILSRFFTWVGKKNSGQPGGTN